MAATQYYGTGRRKTAIARVRLLPGEGAFDLSAFNSAARASGDAGTWGVEILSEAQRARSLEQAAQQSYTATQQLFATL